MVCRLRVRHGERVGLSIYRSPTFLSLPREMRDEIYKQLLIGEGPIKVSQESGEESDPAGMQNQNITTALLHVSKQIALKAAAIFYGLNTFVFAGSESWDLIDELCEALKHVVLVLNKSNLITNYFSNMEGKLFYKEFLFK